MQNLKSAKARVGKRPEANCWGMTAFLLGWRSRLYYMGGGLMEKRLRTRLHRIKKPKASKWPKRNLKYLNGSWFFNRELTHTAVYIGRGKWLHQTGYRGKVRTDTFKQMVRSYTGQTHYYRA